MKESELMKKAKLNSIVLPQLSLARPTSGALAVPDVSVPDFTHWDCSKGIELEGLLF